MKTKQLIMIISCVFVFLTLIACEKIKDNVVENELVPSPEISNTTNVSNADTLDVHNSTTQLIQISTKNISDGVEDSWHESFEYPFFEGGFNKDNIDKLNAEVFKWISDSRIDNDNKNRSYQDIQYSGKSVSEITYKILYDSEDYKTIALYFYWYMGSPHPYTSVQYLTFNASTGEKIGIDFFVKDIPDYKTKINDYLMDMCQQALNEGRVGYIEFDNVPLEFDGTENFYFDKDNNKLIIEYGDYTLSDYASHFNAIEINMSFFKGYI